MTSAVRPAVPTIATDGTGIETIRASQRSALVAARLGVIRGDLWADAAVTAAADFWDASRGSQRSPLLERTDQVRQVTERAASLSPHDARTWLLLASLDVDSVERSNLAAAALKMSYYTGPNETALRPIRLALAARLPSVTDEEIRVLVEHELRSMAKIRSVMLPAIALAYRNGSTAGRRLIETSLEKIDPVLRGTIRPEAPRP